VGGWAGGWRFDAAGWLEGGFAGWLAPARCLGNS
jgi:hypothetical protein